MVNIRRRSKAIAISALSLPVGLVAAYFAYLVVSVVLRVVIPIVVERSVMQ